CGSVSNSGSQVDISGTQHQPGDSSQPNQNDRITAPVLEEPLVGCAADPDPMCRDSYAVGLLPDITLADLASFVPARPALTGEPTGLGVVGMPTNLVAQASEQRIPGTLLDYDVVVRFVPAAFRFDHGDGTSQTASSGGSTWSALRQAEFTPTPTSHVYASRGTYDVSVTVLYRASVDFGSGWRPVDGYVEATTSGYGVRVVEVHTALVDKSCLENPSGPGC
ncbi:MAG: hypothetical protein M3Y31_10410, partial [Gemmatimonadota bacterium]|nr:hypothetical protein [Gemmatimonadota bacterium]